MSPVWKQKKSVQLFSQAQQLLPGGVNSPVRAFRSVGGTPIYFTKAKGSYLFDADNNKYIDYVGSWGPMILGHGHPQVLAALRKQLGQGISFGAPHPLEVSFAQYLQKRIPMLEKLRMVNSGTEAVMGAIRAARGYTGRNKIIKFSGCYHGHADYLLVKAGSGALTFGSPDSAGVPKEFAQHTLIANYNDLSGVQKLAETHAQDLAAIIVEPIVGNMGCILPKENFLEGLRQICVKTGAVFIFDEVMTGFRVHPQGAQGYYHIQPDLITLGKVIGGGLPVGAYGGKKMIMNCVSPEGPVYQAGTLSGNPLALSAGLATLKATETKAFYKKLTQQTQKLAGGLTQLAATHNIPLRINWVCGMLSIFFTNQNVIDLATAETSHKESFKKFFHSMLEQGIYLPPSPFEAWFICASHSDKEITKTLTAANNAFQILKEGSSLPL